MIPTTTIILTTTTHIVEDPGGTAPSTRAVPALPLVITTPPTAEDVEPNLNVHAHMYQSQSLTRVAYLKLKATGSTLCLASRSATFSLLR